MWDKFFEDSSIVQEWVKRGERAGEERGEQRGERIGAMAHARKQLQRLGQAKFGPPNPSKLAMIEAIADLDRLDALGERLLAVNSWNELLTASAH